MHLLKKQNLCASHNLVVLRATVNPTYVWHGSIAPGKLSATRKKVAARRTFRKKKRESTLSQQFGSTYAWSSDQLDFEREWWIFTNLIINII